MVNTHLHFDHAGNNTLFRRAEIVVQREQYDFAQGHPSFPNQYWNDPGLTYRLVEGRAEVVPGVEVLPTPGHVPGHQSVALTLPETGPVLLSGDAVHVQQSYELDNWNGHLDPAAARESAWMLRRMADELGAPLILARAGAGRAVPAVSARLPLTGTSPRPPVCPVRGSADRMSPDGAQRRLAARPLLGRAQMLLS